VTRPLLPETIAALPLRERKTVVLEAINSLGSDHATEEPLPGDTAFAEKVAAWQAKTGVDAEHAAVLEALREVDSPSEPIARLLAAAKSQQLDIDDTPEDQWLGELARRLFGPGGPKVG
jgi:hypothetical protein